MDTSIVGSKVDISSRMIVSKFGITEMSFECLNSWLQGNMLWLEHEEIPTKL